MINDAIFLQQLKYVTDYMVKYKWKYATSGHPTSWSTSVAKKISNCSHMVSMSLQRTGVLKSGQRFYSGTNGVITYLGANTKTDLLKYFNIITVKKTWRDWKKSAKPGDIVCWNFHTSVFAGKGSSGDVWYDAGRQNTSTGKVGGTYTNCHKTQNMDSQKVYYVLRFKDAYRILDMYDGEYPVIPKRGYFNVGDTGTEVKKLQKFLCFALDLPSSFADGLLGEKTKSAVKQFQTKVGINADGLFGNASLEKAMKYHKN